MTFSKDTQLTDVIRPVRHLVLVILLTSPLSSHAVLQPRRPSHSDPIQTHQDNRQTNRSKGARTYLTMVGPAALTFADPTPPLPTEPVMPSLPKTESLPAKSPTAQTEKTSVGTETPPDKSAVEPGAVSETSSSNKNPKPVSILPDDTRQEIRPEEVLPFFQFPTGDNGTNTGVPIIINQAPAAAPPSTATYRQQ